MFRYIQFVFMLSVLFSCKNESKGSLPKTSNIKTSAQLQSDTNRIIAQKNIKITPQLEKYYDSLSRIKFDTTHIEGKYNNIIRQFILDEKPYLPEYDTLLDLNFDGHKDLIIGYFGQAANGINNRIKVYMYNTKNRTYLLHRKLSDLINPSFFPKSKKITSFSISEHAGIGFELRWKDGKWDVYKTFKVRNEGDKTIWKVYYTDQSKNEAIKKPYSPIPPKEIIETSFSFLSKNEDY